MSINIGPASSGDLRPRITVIGIGGAGGNAISNMIDVQIDGVDFIAANTDAQALSNSAADKRIQLGPDITGGLGAGARPEVGKAAAEETVKEIEEALEGVNMVFIAAGMGGGTGTGAAPVIAEAARRKGVLTVGVVTKPFLFEGTRRMRTAEAGIDELQLHVDTLIVIPNQNLFLIANQETTFKEAFLLADEVLQQGVRSITDLMTMPGLINLDFADVRSVMSEMGKAMMGTGEAQGDTRALEAAERAIANPLLDGVSMKGAKGVIISIIGGEDMKLLEVDEAATHIRELVDQDANIIWGSAFNPELEGKIRVSVVATGIDESRTSAANTDTAPLSLASSRAPKRPDLGMGDIPVGLDEVEPEAPAHAQDAAAHPAPVGYEIEDETSMLEEVEDEEEDQHTLDAPFDLTNLQTDDDLFDDDEEEEGDVETIIDPLEGLRNPPEEAEAEVEEAEAGDHAAADDAGADTEAEIETEAAIPSPFVSDDPGVPEAEQGAPAPEDGFTEDSFADDPAGEAASESLELSVQDAIETEADGHGHDGPLEQAADPHPNAAGTEPASPEPVGHQPATTQPVEEPRRGGRRRDILGGGGAAGQGAAEAAPGNAGGAASSGSGGGEGNGGGAGAAAGAAGKVLGAGTTLFERMANLSRGSGEQDEDEEGEEEEGDDSSLSIPRFLGRQNNQ